MAYCLQIEIGGVRAIVRMSGKPPRMCAFCKVKYSTKLCDFALRNTSTGGPDVQATCDAPMCDDCATSVGANRDYCKFHRPKETQETLF